MRGHFGLKLQAEKQGKLQHFKKHISCNELVFEMKNWSSKLFITQVYTVYTCIMFEYCKERLYRWQEHKLLLQAFVWDIHPKRQEQITQL